MCTAGIALRAPDPAIAAPLAPTKPTQAVTVQSLTQSAFCVPGEPTLGRRVDIKQNGDGTIEPFTIPPKTVFVVTSIDLAQQAPASRHITGSLYVASAQQVGAGSVVAIVPAQSDADGIGNGTMTLPSGFPVKSGANLCFLTFPPAGSVAALVHGFFAKDK